jgi:hypothetical protein
MEISSVEWWAGSAAAAELMAANVGRAIWRLVDPPYPTPDGKPLGVRFYQAGESPFTPEQTAQLTAIAKILQKKT